MKKIKIAYFGSSDFSADFLEKLLTDPDLLQLIIVKSVVTQPDRLVGRKQILTPTPVKSIALKHNLEVFEIKDLKLLAPRSSKSEVGKISNLKLKIKNLDLCLLYAYGRIIPQELLTLPKYGFWCLHPSLLPKYRGTSPMATALINGDRETGVTIIKMDEKIDHGPIIAQEKYQILPTDKRPDLEKRLTDLGFEMFKKIINVIARSETTKQSQNEIATLPLVARNDILRLIPQNHQQATYTKKLKKDDGFIDFKKLKELLLTTNHQSLATIYNLFRGLYPWPGLWTLVQPVRLRSPAKGGINSAGKPDRLSKKRLKITDMDYKDGKLIIKKVQLEGKKEVDFETFKKAYKIF